MNPSNFKRLARPVAEMLREEARLLRLIRRHYSNTDRKLIQNYFARQKEKKLHLGCGFNLLENWLNTDFNIFPNVVHLDVTKSFPFHSDVFDFVFSEHLIEHIHIKEAELMMHEIFRVMKPGGTLRISTPDLAFLMDLYSLEKTELQQNYIKWSTNRHIPHAREETDTYVINNFVRDWGHQFIYDEKTLTRLFKSSGFDRVFKRELNESRHSCLQRLENESRMPDGFLAMESLIIEGSKPN